MLAHLIACTLGIFLDRLIGDPKRMPHPVKWIGSLIGWLTKRLNKGGFRKTKGALLVILVVGATTVSAYAVVVIAYQVGIVFGILVEGLLITFGLAQKSLKQAAMEVYEPLTAGNLVQARVKLSWIVGRDTEKLSESEVTRGVVETVSENTSDGVTAPLFWAFLFGAAGIWMYKAVNTLDSMVAYKNKEFNEFGFVAAHTDDVFNYIPSRLTGLLILLTTQNETKHSLYERMRGWLTDAKKHPSPNSGYLEAATAYQLGVQLGGTNYYKGVVSKRATMGQKEVELAPRHIQLAVNQMYSVTAYFWLLGIMIGGVMIVIA
ncbi:adenosylcobinamide-phosphate synthase CbiB [Rummeliibacillus stabekisii]|uniref:adenosylcobinamide-phosphate synthase CbiB n=1 Tax=Rummeliibacillus stabekisii TaxID=241244 RepID=UPI00203FA255|nr:adenosylcobinamide-phosphate synthase CbiB [Rummeliibacillus stabekisii]MCM3315187.1 adenosylcobinamide-phosphate synthase CbiB [Rummeliibacillus stabekisii]